MTPSPMVILEIEGQRFELAPDEWQNLDCIETETNEFHMLENGKSHTITVIDFNLKGRRCTLKVDGEIKEVQFLRELDLLIEKMGLNTAQSKKLSVLHAPMPGLVTGIKVAPGQAVEKGTPLLILEAMKMENVITAPDHAMIKEVKVVLGQAVDKGSVLIEFAAG